MFFSNLRKKGITYEYATFPNRSSTIAVYSLHIVQANEL